MRPPAAPDLRPTRPDDRPDLPAMPTADGPSTTSASPGDDVPSSRRAVWRRQLRDRLPELLATTGVLLVVAAVAGFVVSQWTALDSLGQAALLLAASVVLTVQGTWASRRPGRLVQRLVPLSWAAAAGLTLAAGHVLTDLVLPETPRMAIAVAGVVATVHAGWGWARRTDSVALQLTTVSCAVYAVGPVVTPAAGGWGEATIAWATTPVLAILGQETTTLAGFGPVALGHLLVAMTWIAVAIRLDDATASRVGRIGGALVLAWSALEFNAMAAPVGASLALLVVVGFLLVGIAIEDGLLVGFGAMAGLVTGLRTTWSLFHGETAVTLTVAIAGVALVLAALRLGRARDADDRTPDDATPGGPAAEGPPDPDPAPDPGTTPSAAPNPAPTEVPGDVVDVSTAGRDEDVLPHRGAHRAPAAARARPFPASAGAMRP